MPIIVPGLIALGLIGLVTQWNSYMWPLVMLQTQTNFTLPLFMASLSGPAALAASIVALVPMLVVFLLFQNRFLESVTAGAVAG